MELPDPVSESAVEPKTKGDHDKRSTALARLAAEDPSFRVSSDPESGQTVIKGMGELHLEIIIDRMKREFKVDANIGAPQVAYRETITRPTTIDYTHKKQTGGSGQRSEEHTSELQSLMRISYAVFCLKKKKYNTPIIKRAKH